MLLLVRQALLLLIAFTFCIAATFAGAAEAARPTSTDAATVDALIARLGADKYAERERASREIVAAGISARNALVKALDHSDAEIARRARRALLAVLDADFHVRVARFAADDDPKNDHGLAGWARFQKLAGSDAAARAQFVEMQRAEAVLLELAEQSPQRLADAMIVRSERLQSGRSRFGARGENDVPVASVATLLMLGADTQLAVPDRGRVRVYPLVNYSNFTEQVSRGKNSVLLKKLLAAWIARGSSGQYALQDMWIALRYQIPEGIKPALTILTDEKFKQRPQVREFALLVVAKFGNRSHVKVLEPLLSDASSSDSSSSFRKRARVEVRDVALATMIHLSGQKLKGFGFEKASEKFFDQFDVDSLGFSTDAKRKIALAKWRVWQELQKAKK